MKIKLSSGTEIELTIEELAELRGIIAGALLSPIPYAVPVPIPATPWRYEPPYKVGDFPPFGGYTTWGAIGGTGGSNHLPVGHLS